MAEANIADLSNLQAGDPLDHDIYVDAKEMAPPPPKGEYIFRAADKITLGATQQNFLSAQTDPTIIGPTNEGYQVRFTKVSAKPFKRGQATVSQLGDFLRAVFGPSCPRPRTVPEQTDAATSTASRTFRATGDWEAYDKETKWTLKGMENFPKNADGTFSPSVEVPDSGNKELNIPARKIRANFKIDRYITAS